MEKLSFDKKVFNRGYGFVYTVLQYVFLVGFTGAACMILLNTLFSTTFMIPEAVLPVAVVYIMASVIGFPVVLALKFGARRAIRESTLMFKDGTLIYDRMSERLITLAGYMEERQVYTVIRTETVIPKRCNYVIKGIIEKTSFHNGEILEKKTVDTVKIPNAYIGMERLIKKWIM